MSGNAYHSGGATLLAVETDGETLINVEANASTHVLDTSDGTTGTDNGPTTSRHDSNHVAVLIATSNGDGETPVIVYADSSGNLQIDSM